MPEFETLSSERVEFNNGGEFLELSIGAVKDANRETRYLRISRGFYNADGAERYKKGGLTLPVDKTVLDSLADAIKAWDISLALEGKEKPEAEKEG